MAVKTALDIVPPLIASESPSMNTRWPPLADKSSLPYKLTALSKQKLAREATAPDPDIRRCLGHFRLHCRSVEWAQREMTTKINAIEMEDDEDEDDEETIEEDQRRRQRLEMLRLGEETTNTAASPTPTPVTTTVMAATATVENRPEKSELEVHAREITVEDTATTPEKTIHVQFEVIAPCPSPTPSEKEKDGLLEKGRGCLEKRKPFLLSRAQCMPVRIAG